MLTTRGVTSTAEVWWQVACSPRPRGMKHLPVLVGCPGHTQSVAKRGVIQLNFIVMIFIVAVHKCVHKLILHLLITDYLQSTF